MPEPFLDMICPRCASSLKAQRHDTGLAWRCLKCGGQSLNFSQFRRMIPEAQANGIWETVMARPRAPRRKSLCPECYRDMAAVVIPLGPEQEVELDICRNCQRLWMDRQQRRAEILSDSAPPAPQPRPMPISRAARERMEQHLANEIRRSGPGALNRILTVRILTVLFGIYIITRLTLRILR